MSLKIEYIDKTGLNFYALLYKSDGTAFKPGTQTFNSYSDASITLFNIDLSEDANRHGYYSNNASGSVINSLNDILTVEIWQKIGINPDKTADFLKGTGPIIWNGTQDVGNLETPSLSDGYYLGTYNFSQPVYFYIYGISQYKQLSLLDTTGTYTIVSPSGTTLSSGLLTQVDSSTTPIYQGNFTSTTGIGNYMIWAKGLINGYNCRSTFSFTISTGVSSAGGSILDISQFGAVTGKIVDASPNASSFITNLPNHTNYHYCGQVLSFTSGTLMGAGRVISTYDGSTQRTGFDKSFSATPTNGAPFVVWPLGGSRNVP